MAERERLLLEAEARQRRARALQARQAQASPPASSAPAGQHVLDAQAGRGMGDTAYRQATGQTGYARRNEAELVPDATGAVRSAGVGITQGATFGWGDEIAGMIGGPEATERARDDIAQSREAHPAMYTAGNVAGAAAVPLRAATGAGNVALGAAAGGAFAAGEADEGNRLGAGARGAALGGATTALLNRAVGTLSKPPERVTTDALKTAKRDAYKAVDQAGVVFDKSDLGRMASQFDQALDDAYFVPGMGGKADQWRARIQRMVDSGKPVSLSRLDDIRGNIFKAYRQAPDEVELLDAIRAIDDLIDSKQGGEALAVAREANRRYRNVELLETALVKATDSTAAAGSGGNIENQFRSAFRRILASEKRAQFFRPEELEVMRNFVRGDLLQTVMRRAGKLSPTGNGLMQALNIGAIMHNPAMAGVTVGATGAKAAADNRIQRQAQGVIDFVGTGQRPAGQSVPPTGIPAGVGANALWDRHRP